MLWSLRSPTQHGLLMVSQRAAFFHYEWPSFRGADHAGVKGRGQDIRGSERDEMSMQVGLMLESLQG